MERRLAQITCEAAISIGHMDMAQPCNPIKQLSTDVRAGIPPIVANKILQHRNAIAVAVMGQCPFARPGMPCYTDNQVREIQMKKYE